MGRRKIEILPIQHDRNRSVTFLKRKNGLFKKAYELGVLCSVDVAVIIFGHNNKVYEYCSTDSDAMVQRRLHYTGERDTKTPADFGGDKAGNDDDDDGSDDAGAGTSRGKFATNGKKRGREDDHSSGHLLHLQQHPPRPMVPPSTSLPSIRPPYLPAQQPVDALMEREREREREREGALRQLGLQHLLVSNQVPPPTAHPSLNLAALLQANPLLGLGMPGLNLGLGGHSGQQDLLAMLSANAANINQSTSALYSNPLFSTLFPNHPNVSEPAPHPEPVHKPANTGDIWPSLTRPNESAGGDTSWLSFLGSSRASQPPAGDDVDLSSLFPFDVPTDADEDERGGKRVKR
ncbi:unnamed protein product [Rhizoctonia solani]|uniref:MADS-box domain-containing protein n=1 Tax=Rhizoctonia solani TaxID=456999 RepID=A0A8H3DR74_9AGAM|nr:unnamed protein product [Rhizoctonia solani]